MTREEIYKRLEELGLEDQETLLFDDMDEAFVGIAERFEADGHQYFAVYSFDRMVSVLVASGMDAGDAREYLEFNTVGLFAGPSTPAILRDE